jgi:hypothetical protein
MMVEMTVVLKVAYLVDSKVDWMVGYLVVCLADLLVDWRVAS